MHQFTPSQKLMQGIVRIEEVWTLAGDAVEICPAPACETFGRIRDLTTEALVILKSLRGQIGGQT